MDTQRAEKYARWLVNNKDKKGTSEFEKVAEAYKVARGNVQEAPPTKTQQMYKNVPSSGLQYLKDITYPFRGWENLKNTGKGLYRLGTGAAQLAIPGEQGNEPFARQVGKSYMDRWGGIENINKSVVEDPVGMLADASGMLMLGGTVFPKIAKLGAATDPVNLVLNTGKTTLGKVTPKSAPGKLYESAAKWRTALSPKERAAITQTALKEGILPTSKGIAKARMLVDDLNSQIDDLISISTKTGKEIPRSRVFKYIKDAEKKALKGAEPKRDIAAINAYQKGLQEVWDKYDMKTFDPTDLQTFKKELNARINWNRRNPATAPAREDAMDAVRRAAKEEIEAVAPEVKGLNLREGELLNLLPELERSANRIENLNLIGLGGPLRTGVGGAAAGLPGLLAGGATWLMDMPQVKARTALMLQSAQNQGLMNFMDNALAPAYIRQGLLQSGRVGEKEGQR